MPGESGFQYPQMLTGYKLNFSISVSHAPLEKIPVTAVAGRRSSQQ